MDNIKLQYNITTKQQKIPICKKKKKIALFTVRQIYDNVPQFEKHNQYSDAKCSNHSPFLKKNTVIVQERDGERI